LYWALADHTTTVWPNLDYRNREAINACQRFFDETKSLDKMIEWLRQACSQLPDEYSKILTFCTLTGMRSNECLTAIGLIKYNEHLKIYYNKERQCLEHFRFTNLFIRRTKAVYVSFVNEEIMQIAQNIDKTSHTTA